MTNIYFYSESQKKKEQLSKLCKKAGLGMSLLSPKDISKKVSEIAGLPSGIAIPYPSGIPSQTPTTAFYRMPEVLLFAGLEGKKISRFIDSFKTEGIEPVLLKAMITPYSMGWTLYELIEHLKLEAAGTR